MTTGAQIHAVLGGMKTPDGYKCPCPAHPDPNPSLHITDAGKTNPLVRCFAGCTQEAVLKELIARGLWDQPAGNGATPRPVTTEYPYKTETGELGAIKVRCQTGKDRSFYWKSPDDRGEFKAGLNGFKARLYRLDQLSEAPKDSIVDMVEGEKDVHTLEQELGTLAVCTPHGASKDASRPKWNRDDVELFRGFAGVRLWPDNDDPGRAHMQAIARSLEEIGVPVHWVELPGLGPGGDVSDWMQSHTPEQLRECAEGAGIVPVAPQPMFARDFSSTANVAETTSSSASAVVRTGPTLRPEFPFTDEGNAERMVAHHRGRFRWCARLNKWFAFDGKRWKRDGTAQVERLAKETVRAMYAAAARVADETERTNLVKWAQRSESEQKLHSMMSLSKSEPGIEVEPAEFDTNPLLFNCQNGTLDLTSFELREHRPDDLITSISPVRFDPNARAPVWEQFLDRVMGADEELKCFLQRIMGYCLTGLTVEEKLFFFYGHGRNGKSKCLKAIGHVMGDYANTVGPETLMAKRDSSIPNDIAKLVGVRFVSTVEVEDGRRLAESMVKQITGGDVISARFLHGEYFEFQPAFKIFLAANHKPGIRGTDSAIWERIVVVPFSVTIPEAERDLKLSEKLEREAAGILLWMVAGCRSWHERGLDIPAEVRQATATYRSQMDVLAHFLDECCCLDNPNAETNSTDLYEAYKTWCTSSGEYAASRNQFTNHLEERGYAKKKHSRTRRVGWAGIGLLAEETARA